MGTYESILCHIPRSSGNCSTIHYSVSKFEKVVSKETFLSALREPLRTTLLVFDFKEQSLEQWLIKHYSWTKRKQGITCPWCLYKNLTDTGGIKIPKSYAMYYIFKSGVFHCRMYLENMLSNCHSKAHTIDQCEYNLLNKAAASVRRIEPQDVE